MKVDRFLLLVVVIAWLLPGSVLAQGWTDSGGKKRDALVSVTDFAPRSGAVGTEVVIQGKGFDKKTQLLVGGRPVKPKDVRSSSIQFVMPKEYGDGTIVLRHPDVARDIMVGRFAVASQVQISGFAPTSGVRGTRVEIRGTGFNAGDRVRMNGKELEINRSAPKRLVVTIASDAMTDYLTVVGAGGGEARTAEMFRVSLPAPVITRFEPQVGMPGTTVRIHGENLTPEDKVFYGKRQLEVTVRQSSYVEVVIPPGERSSRVLEISNPNGRAQAATPYLLEKPPRITRFTPTSGKGGITVVVSGSGFRAGDELLLSGLALQITEIRAGQISAVIPEAASTGSLILRRGGGEVASLKPFVVNRRPAIRGFEPRGGKPGTLVTIRGEHFTPTAVVYYGKQKVQVMKRMGADMLVVRLPKKIQDDAFQVQTDGGEIRSSEVFEVYRPAVVEGLTPAQGVPGTLVTLTGRHLRSIGSLYLGKTRLDIEEQDATRLVARIPLGAKSGRIKVDNLGTARLSNWKFEVLDGPSVRLFTPRSVTPGAELVVEGQNLHPETELLLNQTAIPVTRRDKGRIVGRVPGNIRPGEYQVKVRAGALESAAEGRLVVVAPATMYGFSPERVESGDQVVISGKNLDMNTKVYWGETMLTVVSVDDDGRKLVVTAPARAVGVHYLSVESGGVRASANAMLEVVTPRPKSKTKGRKQ